MVCIVVGKWCGDPYTPLFLHPAINTQEQQSDYHSPIIHAVKHMGYARVIYDRVRKSKNDFWLLNEEVETSKKVETSNKFFLFLALSYITLAGLC